MSDQPPPSHSSHTLSPSSPTTAFQRLHISTPTPRKQLSWVKDLNTEGKSRLDLIVEWLGLTSGDQESQSDCMWMCMQSYDVVSTNFSVFRSAKLSKKECSERCVLYLQANGFASQDWKGCKQKIEQLESKFRAAVGWRNATGAGIMERAEEEIAQLRADTDLEIDTKQEEAIKASAAKNTKDMLNRICPFYEHLILIMGERAGNNPLSTAETFGGSQQSRLDVLYSPAVGETQSTSYSGWDPSQPLDLGDSSLDPKGDEDLPSSIESLNSMQPPSSQTAPNTQIRALVSTTPQSGLSSLRLRPPAISNQPSTNTSRRSSGNAGLLKTVRSSLPTQSDFEELNKAQKASNDTNRLLCQHVAEATTSMVGMIGSRLGLTNKDEKRAFEDEDTSVEALATKKAKKDKQDQLDLLKLDRELAQERQALEHHQNGAGMTKLALLREMVDIIARLTQAGVPHAEARKMAEDFTKEL
ncbi:hypothetical protein DFH28DRAFT_1057624 [Melampsora americana]|nr:hypothetical protein DFH28DRAFT_1057624 [Melampsora americana]